MRLFAGCAVVMMGLAYPQVVQSAFLSKNALYEACTSTKHSESTGCSYYIVGIADSLIMNDDFVKNVTSNLEETPELEITFNEIVYKSALFSLRAACIPQRTSVTQLRDVVVNYIKRNPETRYVTAFGVVRESLRATFPCK
jgi:hypothetical protein